MRDHYTHVSDTMRAELVDALQSRWERSLAERAEMEQGRGATDGFPVRSSLPLLDELLEPYRRKVTRIDRVRGARGLQACPGEDRLPFCSQNRTSP